MALGEAKYFAATGRPSHWYAPIAPPPDERAVQAAALENSEAAAQSFMNRVARGEVAWDSNTELVIRGAESEQPALLDALLWTASDPTRRRAAQGAIAEGSMNLQELLLQQLDERTHFRRPDRYTYATLRAKEVPTIDPRRIVSEKGAVQLEAIDTELRDRLPVGWPTSTALPLLYWNGTMHVAVPPDTSSAAAAARAVAGFVGPHCDVVCRRVSGEGWQSLTDHFAGAGVQKISVDRLPPWRCPFVSDREFETLVHELSRLREFSAWGLLAE